MGCRVLHVQFLLIIAISSLLEGSKACEENAIQLVGGQNKFEGRVEVCQDGQWKTVCNGEWQDEEARVVCRQLGFAEDARADRVTWANRFFGNAAANQAIISKRWRCTGSELELLSCPQGSRPSCGHGNDAGVYCYGRSPYDNCQDGELRLGGGGSDGLSGRVEICLDNFWGTVCDDGWDVRDATTVCRQLGLSVERGVPTRGAFFGQGSGPIHLSRAECKSEDTQLMDCTIDMTGINGCDHSEDAGVICNGTSSCTGGEVRLVGGENEQEGRVEICYNGVWGMVCDNGWDEIDATVVCTQLGFGQPGIPVNNTFVPGMGPILLDDVTCVPNYSELFQCVHPLDIGIHNCNRENVAGVICPNITTTLVLLSVTSIIDSDISKSNTPLASPTHLAAILGAVGGALAVVILAAIGIVLVVVVITRRRKAQYTCQDTTRKGAIDNPIYDGSVSVSPLDATVTNHEKDFENPLYSETGPAESEYDGLYSDCTINGEALYENTQNGIVQGTLTYTNKGTVNASEAMYDAVPPTMDSDDGDACYSALGPMDLSQPRLQNQTVVEDEYSCLQHK